MTTAIIILSIALTASIGCSVTLALMHRSTSAQLVAELRANSRERLEADQLADGYKAERDDWAGRAAAHVKRIGELEALLRETSAQRDEAIKARVKSAAQEIRNAQDATVALGRLNSVLSSAGSSKEAGAAADNHRSGTDRLLPPDEA